MKEKCKNCKWFNFKVSVKKGAYGECLNETVDSYISIRGDFGKYIKGKNIDERVRNIIIINNMLSRYSRIYFNEKTFGCIHFDN